MLRFNFLEIYLCCYVSGHYGYVSDTQNLERFELVDLFRSFKSLSQSSKAYSLGSCVCSPLPLCVFAKSFSLSEL